MPDLTTSQRAEVIDLIEAIYSHEGERPELPQWWQWAGTNAMFRQEHSFGNGYPLAWVQDLDLQAFVGVWVPWLGLKRCFYEANDDPIEHVWWFYDTFESDPNFILATARAVRAQQTGGA